MILRVALLAATLSLTACAGEDADAPGGATDGSTTSRTVDAPPECVDAWRTGEFAPPRCEEYPEAYEELRRAGGVQDP